MLGKGFLERFHIFMQIILVVVDEDISFAQLLLEGVLRQACEFTSLAEGEQVFLEKKDGYFQAEFLLRVAAFPDDLVGDDDCHCLVVDTE